MPCGCNELFIFDKFDTVSSIGFIRSIWFIDSILLHV
jgi:hypothetical protein